MIVIPVLPIAKPRMTRRDKWAARTAVVRYRDYKDAIRPYAVDLCEKTYKVTFFLPMPAGWSKKQKAVMAGTLHCQKPDVDNLLKGLMDAWLLDDAAVSSIWVEKRWDERPGIMVQPL